ncbi:elongation factor P maturation arginine rhamnosyltransferase EarP [Mycetohabitans rhizoxinica]|uniref:elongation factor P maturation arginine rhamnosyltransferase EarP n=1 Tax=Mycetohabitans rhizoxinica TaxID=412963 RepID=UPI0030D0E1CD
MSSCPDLLVGARAPLTCDIFCTVIDNFGDAGVCWRLARQLANEYGWQVRLFIDELATLARLAPGLDAERERQVLAGVAIEHWHEPQFAEPGAAVLNIADVVIEAFACDLPASYVAAMAQRSSRVVWINLEYLSSEDWVANFHLRASPHPRHALAKTFFFPGLGAHTGGVLCEQDLDAQRRAFVESAAERAGWWTALGLPQPDPAATVVSLFSYENPALDALLEQWRDATDPLVLLVPQGRISSSVARFFGHPAGARAFAAGTSASAGALSAHALPFTDQRGYDRLLWSADINFVRGEDSFVRAQWARKPFVWHIYPQADDAHLPKLDAALAHIGSALEPRARDALTRFWHAWNGNSTHGMPDWQDFIQHREAFAARAHAWADELAAVGDLAGHLAAFAQNTLK